MLPVPLCPHFGAAGVLSLPDALGCEDGREGSTAGCINHRHSVPTSPVRRLGQKTAAQRHLPQLGQGPCRGYVHVHTPANVITAGVSLVPQVLERASDTL